MSDSKEVKPQFLEGFPNTEEWSKSKYFLTKAPNIDNVVRESRKNSILHSKKYYKS
jgi:hypothetical protein